MVGCRSANKFPGMGWMGPKSGPDETTLSQNSDPQLPSAITTGVPGTQSSAPPAVALGSAADSSPYPNTAASGVTYQTQPAGSGTTGNNYQVGPYNTGAPGIQQPASVAQTSQNAQLADGQGSQKGFYATEYAQGANSAPPPTQNNTYIADSRSPFGGGEPDRTSRYGNGAPAGTAAGANSYGGGSGVATYPAATTNPASQGYPSAQGSPAGQSYPPAQGYPSAQTNVYGEGSAYSQNNGAQNYISDARYGDTSPASGGGSGHGESPTASGIPPYGDGARYGGNVPATDSTTTYGNSGTYGGSSPYASSAPADTGGYNSQPATTPAPYGGTSKASPASTTQPWRPGTTGDYRSSSAAGIQTPLSDQPGQAYSPYPSSGSAQVSTAGYEALVNPPSGYSSPAGAAASYPQTQPTGNASGGYQY